MTGRELGPTANATSVDFALSIRVSEPGFSRYADAVSNPHSPLYGRTLTPETIGRRFGPPLGILARIRRQLSSHGITVVRTYPQRTEIDARASAGVVERYFHVVLHDYLDAHANRYYAPNRVATIPAALAPWVSGVVGLNSRPTLTAADVPASGLTPADAATAYDVTPLRQAGVDGAGLTIAIASFQRFNDQDVATFEHRFGIPAQPAPAHVPIGAGANVAGSDEADLDVEVARGIAPGANVLVFEAPSTNLGEVEMLNRIEASPARIASLSWGECDTVGNGVTPAFRRAVEDALRAAVASGKTFFVASGDSGAYDCQRSDFSDHRLSVDFPSDTPYVVSVGGTLLSVNSDGSYLRETAWNDPLENAGGGGGINTNDPHPSWQVALGLKTPSGRAVPDVSAAASPSSPWDIQTGGQETAVGGTSAATPFWAASMLLAEEYTGQQSACFLRPRPLHPRQQSGAVLPLHDVVEGNNRYYPAGPGWDYATGLGSPDVYNLARDLRAYLETHPKCDSSTT